MLGFGSTCYPRFCAAADSMHAAMLSAGATALLPPCKADAVAGEDGAVWPWLQQLVQRMQGKGWINSSVAAEVLEKFPASNTDKVGGPGSRLARPRLSPGGLRPVAGVGSTVCGPWQFSATVV